MTRSYQTRQTKTPGAQKNARRHSNRQWSDYFFGAAGILAGGATAGGAEPAQPAEAATVPQQPQLRLAPWQPWPFNRPRKPPWQPWHELPPWQPPLLASPRNPPWQLLPWQPFRTVIP